MCVLDVLGKNAHKVVAYEPTANKIIIINGLLIQKLISSIIEPATYVILNAEAARQNSAMALPQKRETIV